MMLSSKFTFSLIAIAALLVSGSGLVLHNAYGFDAPEFTCNHINKTATHCTFDMAVNGTLRAADWGIRYLSTQLLVISHMMLQFLILQTLVIPESD